ncbi:unnamed protein product, partial [Rotaria magnacalcarata]
MLNLNVTDTFGLYTQSKLPTDGKISAKIRPQWLLVGHHELP